MNDLLIARNQVRYEQKAYWRNPMAAVFTFMFPVVFLVVVGTSAGSSLVPGTTLEYYQYVVVAMLTFGLIAACYTNLGMTICLRRDSGVLKRMRGTPISIGSYMGGIIGSVIINVALLTVLVVGIGMVFYHLHFPYHLAAVLLTLLIGIVTFCALGMAVTVLVTNADAAPAVINGIYFPIVFISGVFYPLSNGSVLSRIADYFPVRHLILALVSAFERGPGSGLRVHDLVVMLLWAAAPWSSRPAGSGGSPGAADRPARRPVNTGGRRRYPEPVSLRSLPPLLRNEPAMARVVGASTATLAVATPAQAFVLAGLVRLGTRRPVLVVTPTGAAPTSWPTISRPSPGGRGAPRCRRRTVEVFPAWETLPFERVSPDVSTMGRRLRLLWQLGGAAEGRPGPGIVVAPIKAVLQRLGPWRSAARPVVVAKGDQVVVEELVGRLVAMGYRRESIVEHRGELAVRGGIVDVFPSTADEPVRIDLWGDEVDRLTRFDVSDQRSIDDLAQVELFGCRELVLDDTMREAGRGPGGLGTRGAATSGTGWPTATSSTAWSRGSRGWPTPRSWSPTCWAMTPWWCWSSPAGSGTGPASCSTRSRRWPTPWPATWGLEAGDGAPRLHVALRPPA